MPGYQPRVGITGSADQSCNDKVKCRKFREDLTHRNMGDWLNTSLNRILLFHLAVFINQRRSYMSYLFGRLREPSTWAGIATLVATAVLSHQLDGVALTQILLGTGLIATRG